MSCRILCKSEFITCNEATKAMGAVLGVQYDTDSETQSPCSTRLCHKSTSRGSQEKMFWRAKRDFSDARRMSERQSGGRSVPRAIYMRRRTFGKSYVLRDGK